jgi:hypothetical protein
MLRKKRNLAKAPSDAVSPGAQMRALPAFYFVILVMILGTFVYALTQRSDAPVDHNVPGATTGAGKASLKD